MRSLSLGGISLQQGGKRNYESDASKTRIDIETAPDPFVGVLCGYGIFLGAFVAGLAIVHIVNDRGRRFWLLVGLCVGGMVAGLGWSLWLQWLDLQQGEHSDNSQLFQHDWKIVQQKLLTLSSFRYTVITRGLDMANVLNTDKQIAIIGQLAEGSSIRSVGLHFAYYNFVKRHNTLRCTPAMAAGVAPTFWSVGDLLEAAA
jgi:hypothetical protein